MLALELDGVLVQPVAEAIVIVAVDGLGDLVGELEHALLTDEMQALGQVDELLTQL